MPDAMVPVSALPGRRMPKAERELRDRITNGIADRVVLIQQQPWRVFRNRRLRGEIDALMEASWSEP